MIESNLYFGEEYEYDFFIGREEKEEKKIYTYYEENEEMKCMQSTESESKKDTENGKNNNESQKMNIEYGITKIIENYNENQESVFTNTIDSKVNKGNDILMDNISDFDINKSKNINSVNLNLKSGNEQSGFTSNTFTKKRGRNKTGNTGGVHNKYSDDNVRRKCKHLVLNSVFKFINDKLSSIYPMINKGIFTKKLQTINQRQIANATIEFNKKFLHKKLKDIFSDDISKRYTNFLPDHNKKLINYLVNEEDKEKKEYFTELFNLTFLNCLEHFRGTANYFYLEGLATFEDIKINSEWEDDYSEILSNYLMKYEIIINNKKERSAFSYDY